MRLSRARIARCGIALALAASGCRRTPAPLSAQEIPSPAGAAAAQPSVVAGRNGLALLTWLEPDGDGHALRFATRRGGPWSAPRTVTRGRDWFINWADFPSAAIAGESLGVHWLDKSSSGKYSYDVRVALSRDGGDTWTAPITPHRDGTPTEHGFVSLVPWGDGGVGAVWLDGRHTGGHDAGKGAMGLVHATIAADGTLGPETVLDDRVCDCCQTSAAPTDEGMIVAYRDRTADEVRDVSVVRHAGGKWSSPRPVANDGWRIDGCPVNGPAVAANGRDAVVAWFTAAGGESAVKVAFSHDAGATFSSPLRIDGGGPPLGRVDVVMRPSGEAIVAWMEKVGERAEIRVRRVLSDGGMGAPATVGSSEAGRSSGFPRMDLAGDDVVIAWTESGSPSRVRTAVIAAGR